MTVGLAFGACGGGSAEPDQSFLFEFGYGLGVWKKAPVVNSDSAWLRRLFERRPRGAKTDQCVITLRQLQRSRCGARARIAKTATKSRSHFPSKCLSTRGQALANIIHDRRIGPGAVAEHSIRSPREAGAQSRRGRIRPDPVNCLAFVNISSIRLITDSDSRVFYSASSAADFAQINVSEGLLKHETDGILALVATDSDPQVFLPELNFPSGDSWHLEVDLEVHTAPSNIILRQKETFAEIQALQTEKQRQNAATVQAKLDREQIASIENERAQNEERVRNIEQQKKVTESELEETRRALLKSRDETARFSSQLETNARRMKNKSATLNNKKKWRRGSLKKHGALCSKAGTKPRDFQAFWKFGIRTALVSHFTTPGSEAGRRFRADCSPLAWPRSMAIPRCPRLPIPSSRTLSEFATRRFCGEWPRRSVCSDSPNLACRAQQQTAARFPGVEGRGA